MLNPNAQPGGSVGAPPAPAGRPAPRLHLGPSLGQSVDGDAPVLSDRRPGLRRRGLPHLAGTTGYPSHHARARSAPGSPPHDPEAYPARHAVVRGLGGLKGWRRVATCYAPYTPRCLSFLPSGHLDLAETECKHYLA